ncbi:MAG: hypothetical protein RAO92_09190 [Candidatus Euphemobacter frigidus]|nr:hypothetical protein [Candidatus Euphemobacter frigidus]MDP8276561.1 hypothetical protein [Candidatus Euphemobacter frigidus]
MSLKKALQFTAGIICLFVLVTIGSTQETTEPPPIETMADMEALFAYEPSYQQIQQVAMRYAEVHPDKIAAWRRGASLRAFLPEVQFDYDWKKSFEINVEDEFSTSFDTSYSTDYGNESSEEDNHTREYGELDTGAWSLKEKWTTDVDNQWSSSESYGEESGESRKHDESEKTDRDKRWKIKLEWDLRDFIFNKEQIRISKEARDLVELRQDVLEEVNTYFFDRRRAQIEMLFSPPGDVRSKIDLQLQIARVTANIDALTGGFLSNALKEAEAKR